MDSPVEGWQILGAVKKDSTTPAFADTADMEKTSGSSKSINDDITNVGDKGVIIAYDSPSTLYSSNKVTGETVNGGLYREVAFGYELSSGKFQLYCQGATVTTYADGKCLGTEASTKAFLKPLQTKKK